MFNGRKLVIATKHNKEVVLQPVLEAGLGVCAFLPGDFDTDTLGTFSGEIDRADDPVSTVRKKCLLAMDQYQCDMGVASEGSFGPHPEIPFMAADDEWLIFIDSKNKVEVVVREISMETNFSAAEVNTEEQLKSFANKVLFPSHALILRTAPSVFHPMEKGINNWQILLQVFKEMRVDFGSVYVESDMRAMYNPSRMKVIHRAAENLVSKLNSVCPACSFPGFSITKVVSGLPCNWCGYATASVLYSVYRCKRCLYTREEKFPNNKTTEDPMYCQRCNP